MKKSNFLQSLECDKDVYYIYEYDLSIYGVKDFIDKYVVVSDKDFSNIGTKSEHNIETNKDWIKYDNQEFLFLTTEEWFNLITDSSLFAFECIYLNKRFIIKEHVKITQKPDILQLRKNFDSEVDPFCMSAIHYIESGNFEKGKLLLFNIIKNAILINQIIDNYKIVNHKLALSAYEQLMNSENNLDKILKTTTKLWKTSIVELYDKTDKLLENKLQHE